MAFSWSSLFKLSASSGIPVTSLIPSNALGGGGGGLKASSQERNSERVWLPTLYEATAREK